MKYYIKKLGKNELGSVGRDRAVHRGRFLLVSKRPQMLEFFPPLSETQKNDFAPVALVPLYQNSSKRIYCNFVYHNDRFHGGTRNEYRLYSNKELEGGDRLFKPGDYLLMRKINEKELNPGFYVDLITSKDKTLYWFCKAAVEASPVNGGYASWAGVIEPFETKVNLLDGLDNAVSIDGKVLEAAKSASAGKIEDLFSNQAMFRDFLLVGYEGKCAITRTSIEYGDYFNVEAAHLRPKSQRGLYLPSNGITLTRDLHWAFDKGFFTLTKDFRVQVHPKVDSEYLHSLESREIFMPKDPFFKPNPENVKWHREHVYGLFLKSGVIRGMKS